MGGRTKHGEEGGTPRWRVGEFVGLLVFLALAAAVLPFVRDAYIIQDVWLAICGAIGLD